MMQDEPCACTPSMIASCWLKDCPRRASGADDALADFLSDWAYKRDQEENTDARRQRTQKLRDAAARLRTAPSEPATCICGDLGFANEMYRRHCPVHRDAPSEAKPCDPEGTCAPGDHEDDCPNKSP